jgi:hypothetical protein
MACYKHSKKTQRIYTSSDIIPDMASTPRWEMGDEWAGHNSIDEETHKTLVLWIADCVEHALHYFEDEYPEENQPRRAIEAARAWAHDEISMTEAREVALKTHEVARETEHTAAREAARATGHAAATAHVDSHAKAAANYALKAIDAASNGDSAVDAETEWQYERLPEKLRSIVTTDQQISD